MSDHTRRLVLIAGLLAVAAIAVWMPPAIGGGLLPNSDAQAVAGASYVFLADTDGWGKTANQSVVTSAYDLRTLGALSSFPLELGDWKGVDVPSNGTDLLGFSMKQHIFRQYTDAQGHSLWLRLLGTTDWQMFYHTPLICYENNNWTLDPEEVRTVPLGGATLPVRSFIGRQAGTTHLVLYSFLWPDRFRDMSEGATMIEVVVPVNGDGEQSAHLAETFLKSLFVEHSDLSLVSVPAIEHSVNANLDNKVTLLGYDQNGETLLPGDKLTMTLYWEVTGKIDDDYTVFVHVLNPDTGDPKTLVLAQKDSQPFSGMYPTSAWKIGQVLKETYELEIPSEAAAGERRIEVGMYRLSDNQRLQPLDKNGHPIGDSVMLPGITIVGP